MKNKIKKIFILLKLNDLAIQIKAKGLSLLDKIYTCLYRIFVKLGVGLEIQKFFLPRQIYVKINPQLIKYVLCSNYKDETSGYSNLILAGNWDKIKWSLKEDRPENPRALTLKTIKQLFIENKPYKECEQYIYMKTQIEQGLYQNAYWCMTMADVDNYFNILLKTYDDIKNNGYKSQKEIIDSTPHVSYDEIQIFIDRNGEMILGFRGTHRILIVDLLKLQEVPAILSGVHREWMKFCCCKHKSDILTSLVKEIEEKNAPFSLNMDNKPPN